jgi:hypothetical protein
MNNRKNMFDSENYFTLNLSSLHMKTLSQAEQQHFELIYRQGRSAIGKDLWERTAKPWETTRAWHQTNVRQDAPMKAYIALKDHEFASEVARLTNDSHLAELARTVYLRSQAARTAPSLPIEPRGPERSTLSSQETPRIDSFTYLMNAFAPGRLTRRHWGLDDELQFD